MAIKIQKIDATHVSLFVLVVLTLLCLAPFAGKSFNIDEPLFIWVAHQIQAHPLDFYGFRINWYGYEMSAAEVIKNPPAASYFIALSAAIGGLGETLHYAFLLPALAAVTGTYFLAREITQNPLTATLISMLTPVFMLSSSTVMCDTMMLAAYVWAVTLWVRGMRRNSYADLIFASFLIALSSLTKYYGMSLIPLLLLYSLFSKNGGKQRVLLLLLPVAILCTYQWGTKYLYGRGLLLDAAEYATSTNKYAWQNMLSSILTGLSFTGGCLVPTLFFAPRLWGRRALLAWVTLIPLLALVLSQLDLPTRPKGASWGYFLQLALFIVAGIHLGVLAGRDLWESRDSESLLLFLWFFGTFVFAAFVNWTVNGRSILPMVPVAGILVIRALVGREHEEEEIKLMRSWSVAGPLVCAWLISMMVMWADYSLAGTTRKAAEVIVQNYGKVSKPLFFQGHWGFQYYMEKNGAVALDVNKLPFPSGRIIVMPENNTNAIAQASFLTVLQFAPVRFLTIVNKDVGAGYYSSIWGALPFAFGNVPDEKYYIAILQ